MGDKWEGFSEDDILAMKSRPRPKHHTNENRNVSLDTCDHSESLLKKTTIKQIQLGKKNNKRERLLEASPKQLDTYNVSSDAALFNPMINNEQKQSIYHEEDSLIEDQDKRGNKNGSTVLPEVLEIPPVEISLQTEESSYVRKEESLDDFEKRHKMIKEQNRMKKELLKLALEDRTKKTKEEARRLGDIEEELKKIDAQLSSDVGILRNQIEVASLDFMEAQKRYDRAEREFLDAKMELFTRRERKELLTGHLCTIIEQSELRKAHKLSALMDKLRLGSVIIEKPMDMSMDQKEAKEENVNYKTCQDQNNT